MVRTEIPAVKGDIFKSCVTVAYKDPLAQDRPVTQCVYQYLAGEGFFPTVERALYAP